MRLIDADKVEKYFDERSDKEFPYHDEYSCGLFDAYSHASNYIDSCETVEAEPIVHAHWITFLDGEDDGVFCSHCKSDLLNMFPCIRESHLPKRCPECGAKMDEEADDESIL